MIALDLRVVEAAKQEDEEAKKTAIHCLRLPPNQHHVVAAYARNCGIDVPAFVRRVLKEWITTHA